MDARRRRFFAALGLYLAWAVALAAMALTSGSEPPPPRPPAAASK